jgi:hypothetical protein
VVAAAQLQIVLNAVYTMAVTSQPVLQSPGLTLSSREVPAQPLAPSVAFDLENAKRQTPQRQQLRSTRSSSCSTTPKFLEALSGEIKAAPASYIIHEAAALIETRVQNHPFVDGNKRDAFGVVTDKFGSRCMKLPTTCR